MIRSKHKNPLDHIKIIFNNDSEACIMKNVTMKD